MHGCCKNVDIDKSLKSIEIDTYTYGVTIVYCKNCGSLKSTTNVRQIKNDNKTKY